MKIIFLDINGVLTNKYNYPSYKTTKWFGDNFDPKSIMALNQIVKRTKANIVISSNWRLVYCFAELKTILLNSGIKANIIGETPCLMDKQSEISAWLIDKSIDHYIILDDNELEDELQAPDPDLDLHLLRIENYTGLQSYHIDSAIKILNT